MRFALLGPMAVADEAGGRVEPAGPRLRVLLAALLLHANAPVSCDALAEAVWDGQPPPAAGATLRSYVRRLRIALGPQGASRIEARDPGYLIRVEPAELDVLEFEALCRDAGVALRAGTWTQAAGAAARALELWRDTPLLDVPSKQLRDAVSPRLEQLRLHALEDRIEADLHLGSTGRLVPELRNLTASHPLRERFHAQLMLALAHAGRQAEALEAYRAARGTLVEHLGIEPGSELRRLHKRILAGGGDLIAPQAAAAPAPRPTASVPRQLPAAPGHFTGRHAELDVLTRLLDQPDTAAGGTVVISAIDGMAGIGKTALAVHAAHRLSERFPGGQLFLDLFGFAKGVPPREPVQALEALLRALGVSAQQIPADLEERAALYRQRLVGTRTLIVLDNALDEAQVRPLLPGHPGCLVLVTSRRRLKGLDDARSLSLDLLPPAHAAALLRAVAGPGRIPADDPLLDEVAQLCGRLPLALRIAGALLRHRPAWSLEHLAGLLHDQQQRVRALSDGERNLATVFDLSYSGLTEHHRACFRRLGLVPGPETDAYAAAALLETDPGAAVGLLEDLVDHNLLIEHALGRYRMHDLIRAHARTLVGQDSAEERRAALDRLMHYYAHTAQSASIPNARYPRPAPHGPAPSYAPAVTDPEAARIWLRAEGDNLEAACDHARTHGLDEHVVALAAGLAEMLRTDGSLVRAVELHRTAAETARRIGRPTACAAALNELARAQHLAGDYVGAEDTLAEALKLYRENGDDTGEAGALIDLGRARYLATDIGGAGDAVTRALEIYRGAGNRHGVAMALNELGRGRQLAGDYPGARDALTRALNIYREIGNRLGEATALHDLAGPRLATGDLAGAAGALAQALEFYREIGHRQGQASSLVGLGIARSRAGAHAAAGEDLSQALRIFRENGARGDEAWSLSHYAATVAARGDLPRAITLYQQALEADRELRKPDDEAFALEGLAECHLAGGDTETALACLKQALEIYRQSGMAAAAERVRTRLASLTTA